MDLFWLLVVIGVAAYFFFRSSSSSEPSSPMNAAPSPPTVGDESPITTAEWKHFQQVVTAAVAQATDSIGMVREIPYLYRLRMENSFIPCIQAWKDDKLKFDERRRGVSAHLVGRPTLYVYTGEWKSIGGMMQHERIDRTSQAGPWNAEVRGMVKAIEGTLKGRR
jgi:hypothetical protein